MTFQIIPVAIFNDNAASDTTGEVETDRFRAQLAAALNSVQTAFGQQVVTEVVSRVPDSLSENQVIFLFDYTTGTEYLRSLASCKADALKRRILLMDAWVSTGTLQLLDETNFGGLITHRAFKTLGESATTPMMGLMGQAHGFYGLRALFDATFYDMNYFELFSDDVYGLFYNREVHTLERLLLPYLTALVASDTVTCFAPSTAHR